MVDLFSLVLTHVLLALAAWRLMQRDDLDRDPAPAPAGVDSAEAAPDQPGVPPPPGHPGHAVPRLQELGPRPQARPSRGVRRRA